MSFSSSSTLRIREITEDDLPALARISIAAFRGRPMNEAMFPERLRQRPGDADRYDVVLARRRARLGRPHVHNIAVVDDGTEGEEVIVGSAEWQSVPEPLLAASLVTPEGRAARDAGFPASLDREAVAVLERESVLLDQTIRDALGEEGYENSWYLAGISVDPAHQRRGIGRMIMEWGHERAAKEHKNLRLMASEAGSKLYRAMGYQEVGSRDILGGTEYAFIKRAE